MTKPTTYITPLNDHHEEHQKLHHSFCLLFNEFFEHFPAEDHNGTTLIEFHNWSLSQYYEPDHEHGRDGKIYEKGGEPPAEP